MAKAPKKQTKQEKENWDKLYEYVRHNVMNYDENQSLSRTMVLRLKGLLNNKFMANKNIESTANYSYEVVLNAFKYCNSDIQRGFINNSFRDETHKFNYALKIVESNLNTVYLRMKRAENAKEEVDSHDTSNTINYVNTFKSREDKNDNKKFDDLW